MRQRSGSREKALRGLLFTAVACLCSAAWGLAPPPDAGGAGRMPALITQYSADEQALEATYAVRVSPLRMARLEKFLKDEQSVLQSMDFASLSELDKIDYLLLKNHITSAQHRLAIEKHRIEEMQPLLPFARTITELADGMRTVQRPDAERAAAELTAMVKQIDATRKAFEPPVEAAGHKDGGARAKVNPIVAYRANRAVGQLRESLKGWFNFSNSYDPTFTWWVGLPYRDAEKALLDYQTFLKEKLVGIPDGDKTTIIGDPVGREALLADLEDNLIPYTPEELMAMALRPDQRHLLKGRQAASRRRRLRLRRRL